MAREIKIDLSDLTDDQLEDLYMAVTVETMERDTVFWEEIEQDRDEHQRAYTTIKQWGHA